MKLRLISLSIAAVVMASAATSGSAHEFASTATGTIKVAGVGSQMFFINKGIFDCQSLIGTGTASTTKAESQSIKLTFSECEFAGDSATVTTAPYLFDASGVVSVLEKAVITVPVGKCSVLILGPSNNSVLGTMKFASSTKNKTLKVVGNVHGIEYEPRGSTNTCGTAKVKATNGRWEGEATSEVEGATLEWK